ncbi:MAG: hypothetical protein Q4F65_01040 [Propionibacteriaceae bacterium]|nr:hypothetical protein [Propionibacteriaceae bacterium]
MTWTDEQNAELNARLRRENIELAEWSAAVLAGKIRLEGAERDAQRLGFWHGRQRADDDTRKTATQDYTARQRIAYARGVGEGRAMSPVPEDAVQPPSAAELIRKLRQERGL